MILRSVGRLGRVGSLVVELPLRVGERVAVSGPSERTLLTTIWLDGDAGVEGLVDHLDRGFVVGIAPGAEDHGTQAQSADGDTGVAQDLVLHGSLLWMVGDLPVFWASPLSPESGPSSR
jgi:hypothetical protein